MTIPINRYNVVMISCFECKPSATYHHHTLLRNSHRRSSNTYLCIGDSNLWGVTSSVFHAPSDAWLRYLVGDDEQLTARHSSPLRTAPKKTIERLSSFFVSVSWRGQCWLHQLGSSILTYTRHSSPLRTVLILLIVLPYLLSGILTAILSIGIMSSTASL